MERFKKKPQGSKLQHNLILNLLPLVRNVGKHIKRRIGSVGQLRLAGSAFRNIQFCNACNSLQWLCIAFEAEGQESQLQALTSEWRDQEVVPYAH